MNFIKSFSEKLGHSAVIDRRGNLIVTRSGVQPSVIIQGHVDMVTEKNRDTVHDFSIDAIKTKVTTDANNVEWLAAEGTTLGADNGLAVATAMAIMELPKEELLPEIEFVFTVEEETGLYGAAELDASLVKSNILLNLDSEEWGTVTIGCAGGAGIRASAQLPVVNVDGSGLKAIEINVRGLIGGHSGINIHEPRGNALRILAKLIEEIFIQNPKSRLALFSGGDKDNAIPRESKAIVLVEDETALKNLVDNYLAKIKPTLPLEPNATIVLSPFNGAVDKTVDKSTASAFLQLVHSIFPHGALKMSETLTNTTETSCNVAKIELEMNGSTSYLLSARSFHDSVLVEMTNDLEAKMHQILAEVGATTILIDKCDFYPGWAPAASSSLVDMAAAEMQKELDAGNSCGYEHSKVDVVAIHAGLECGVLNESLAPRLMDMVSFGPTIRGAHSPDEVLRIDTVQPFVDVTLRILKNIASGEYIPLKN